MNRLTRRGGIAAGTMTAALAAAAVCVPAPAAPALAASAARPSLTAAGHAVSGTMLREGDQGPAVRKLQERLAALKYYPGPADGRFGPDTEEAVWAFQEVQGIHVDGIVGPVTARYLARPKPYVPRYPRGGADRVEVNLSMRVLVLYRNHSVALVSHISAGGGYRYCDGNGCQAAVTPAGRFRTTGYLPGWVKVPLGAMYNPVFFVGDEYAIHGDTDVPLGPVSHGCIRIPMDIARLFHAEVQTTGMPVYVYR